MEQHIHPMYDDDVAHFHIDTDSRAISHTTAEKLVLIQGDHNSEIYTFDIPRFNDGHDMMLCNLVQIHFINIDANNSQNVSSGVYEVLDMQLDPLDPNTCICSWTISSEATPFVGRLTFALRFACMQGSRCTYVWNTQIFDGVPVQKSYNNSDLIMSEYTDILEKWYWEFVNTTTAGVNVIADAKDKAIAEIETVLFNRGGISVSEEQPTDSRIAIWIKPSDPLGTIRLHNFETGDFDTVTLDTIKGEKGDKGDKGDPGDPTTFIVQEFGNNTDKVVSQAVITGVIERVEDDENRITGLELNMNLVEPLANGMKNVLEYNDGSSTRLNNIESEMGTTRDLIGSVETRIISAEGLVDNNDDRISNLETKLSINSETGELTRITDIESEMVTTRDLIGSVEGLVDNNDDRISNLETKLSINSETGELTRISDIESDIKGIKGNQNIYNDWMFEASDRLETVEGDVNDLTNDVRILQSLTDFDTEKYDALADKIATVEETNTTQGEAINGLTTDMTNANDKIAAIENKNTQQDETISALGDALNELSGDYVSISTYQAMHDEFSSRIKSLEDRVGLLESQI